MVIPLHVCHWTALPLGCAPNTKMLFPPPSALIYFKMWCSKQGVPTCRRLPRSYEISGWRNVQCADPAHISNNVHPSNTPILSLPYPFGQKLKSCSSQPKGLAATRDQVIVIIADLMIQHSVPPRVMEKGGDRITLCKAIAPSNFLS